MSFFKEEKKMKYDFESVIERKGKDALAVDGLGMQPGFSPDAPKEGFDCIPMWVADMNFAAVPSIVSAVRERLEHPLFGYFIPREEYYEAIISWQKSRNHVQGLEKKHIGYENGVLGGLVSALGACIKPGGNVLLHSPTYIGFTKSISAAGYHIILSPLKKDADGIWRMDYEDMARKIRDNDIQAAVFCNPHNPTGRVWSKEEMEKAMEVYKTYGCTVIADEIWSDIILEKNQYIPFETINEDAKQNTVALYAPSKTFNLAGLVGAYHIIYNDELRGDVEKESKRSHYNEMNLLSMCALIGAYSEDGEEWLCELKEVLSENVDYACNYIKEHFSEVEITKPEGTYMLFLDCGQWCKKNKKSLDVLLKAGWDVGVAWQDGRPFHGEYAIRMNLALPMSRVREAFDRLKEYVFI